MTAMTERIAVRGRFGSLADAPASLVLAGVRVVDPGAGIDEIRDLAIVEGRIADAAHAPAETPRIQADGLVAVPGLCDLHTHLREPGGEGAETIESGSRAAAHGGFTTVCAMPNTEPPLDEEARIAWVQHRAAGAACVVRVVAAATHARAGEALTDAAALAALGVVGFSDDGAAIPTARLARSALAALGPLGLPLIEHPEDATLAAGSVMRAGPTASRLGLPGWPASAELTVVLRDLVLAEETGAWLHLTHLSTAAALDAVRQAKARGVRVTCDVTPHHLALTDAWVAGDRSFSWEEPGPLAADRFGPPLDLERAYDGTCRVNPPLTTRADALALLAGVADGTVDAIATDHAPHPPQRTIVELGAAAPGLVGLETALSLGLAAVGAGRLTMAQLVAALSTRPAALIGEERGLAPDALGGAHRLRSGRALARGAGASCLGILEHAAPRPRSARRGAPHRRPRPRHLGRERRPGLSLSSGAARHRRVGGHRCGLRPCASRARIWDHRGRHLASAHGSRMSIRYNEELDPNEGPSFTEFAVLATLFAVILLLIPVGVFTLNWPVWVLGLLMILDLVLLFLVSMTAVFLLRVFFADRRRGRGRTIGVAKEPMVISTQDAAPSATANEEPMAEPDHEEPH